MACSYTPRFRDYNDLDISEDAKGDYVSRSTGINAISVNWKKIGELARPSPGETLAGHLKNSRIIYMSCVLLSQNPRIVFWSQAKV
jgi:hypothetical protein